MMLATAIRSHCQAILGQQPGNRLLALDVFRGITITAMILVNNPGSWQHIYGPMRHAQWHGWTLTDLIFPFFIFIVGVSIQLSGQRMLASGTSRSSIIKQALLRTFKLVLLGWFLALFYYDFGAEHYNWVEQRLLNIRFMGVLQRIAVVYFICVLMWLFLSKRGLLVSFVGILLLYWLALAAIPYYDNAGNSYSGLLEFGNNLSAWLDSWLFAAPHLYYSSATPFAFDPEGILSTLPAVASGISGMLVGYLLTQSSLNTRNKTIVLLVLGSIGVLLGELWHGYFPINKALWTSSYVLLTSAYACLVLASLIFILDSKKNHLLECSLCGFWC
ncbi:acyltransferase family protein [Paraglaciecola arctica]|uniref:Heparan-alpha-glucosaminide N-acetyltransferase n=1 Tax=Paraglaciecola arctica BSs20135 TaxID=493475 RepID=K6YQM4_9ALTE|nr:heparan-alpha-glucosaminide N-acetyltransferase domain-containing protein [Paraglaciecola arctica]GAC18923.1 heparan-alpha-glucosaminide N-acetyltransferase [Paraglaciecola arctica BSs20135]